jgi:hypothetical protein
MRVDARVPAQEQRWNHPKGATMTDIDSYPLGRPTSRPDLTGRLLDLAPGDWWSLDGHLHIEVESVGEDAAPGSGRELPGGWAWMTGDLYLDGRPVNVCTVPVRLDALPARELAAV